MNLTDVIDLLKGIINNCSDLEGKDFLFAPSKILGSTVDGYGLHISGTFIDEIRKYLNDVAIDRKLSITQHPESIMIYRAKNLNDPLES